MPSYDAPYLGAETFEDGGETVPLGVVELRVHGVNGGSAEHNLQDAHPIRVSGTATAGFYRRRSELDHNQVGYDDAWKGSRPEQVPEPERVVEAYNWSSINSGKKARAWWALLFPFAAANLAGYLLPKGLNTGRSTFARSVLRLLALLGTVVTVVGLTLISVDLFAVQCGGTEACTDRFWLGWLDTIVGWGDLRNHAGQRAVAFMVVPVLALIGLWILGRRGARYEDYGGPRPRTDDGNGVGIDGMTIGQEAFWRAPDSVYVLTWLHATAGLAAVAGTMALALAELTAPGGYRTFLLCLAGLSAVLLAVTVAGTLLFHRMEQVPAKWLRKPEKPASRPRRSWFLSFPAAALLVAVGVAGWLGPSSFDAPPLDAMRHVLIWCAVAGLGLLAIAGFAIRAYLPLVGGIIAGGALAVGLVTAIGGSGTTWVRVELGVAAAGILLYAALAAKGRLGHNDTAWIYLGLAAVVVVGIYAFNRSASLWHVIPIPVVYLLILFVLQVWWGNDPPASEEMRIGPAVVLAGLGFTAVLTLVSGLTIFTAQRLGSDVAFDGAPVLGKDVSALIEADVVHIRSDGTMVVEGPLLFERSRVDPWSQRVDIAIQEFVGTLQIDGSETTTHIAADPTSLERVLEQAAVDGARFEIRSAVGTIVGSQPDDPGVEDMLVVVDDLFGTVGGGGADGAVATFEPAAFAVTEDGFTLDGTTRIYYPAEMGWYAVAALAGFIVFLVGLLLRLLALWMRWRTRLVTGERGGKVPKLSADYDADEPEDGGGFGEAYDLTREHRKRRFARKAATLRWAANATDDIDWILSSAVYTSVALFVAIVVVALRGGEPQGAGHDIVGFASLAISFTWIGLYLLIRQAKENRRIRRTMGIVWDVTAFFPRRFHPLAPPCYGEQAVLDLRNRIIQVRRHEPADAAGKPLDPERHGRLLIVAHSFGTMLTAAALMTLQESERGLEAREDLTPGYELPEGHAAPSGTELDGVMFVTYGCMLRRLFNRAWPTQLPLEKLYSLKHRLELGASAAELDSFPCPPVGRVPRWINFGRYTDYLGGRVFADLQAKPTKGHPSPEDDPERGDDLFFVDPVRRWRQWGQFEHARSWTHSFNYQSDMEDPRFRRHVWRAAWILGHPSLEERLYPLEKDHPTDCVCHPTRFVLEKRRAGRFRFALKAADGDVFANSQTYTSKAAAMKGIESVRANAGSAAIEDQTG